MEELYLVAAPSLISTRRCGESDRRVSIIGVPLDVTSSFRPGSRFAPRAIREAYNNIEAFSFRKNLDVDDYCLDDMGDVSLVPGSIEENLRRIKLVAESLFREKSVLGLLGGEHLATYPVVKALTAIRGTPCMLVLDAHLDLRDDYLGLRLSHASVMRRIAELLGYDKLVYVGTRAVSGEEVEHARRMKVSFITGMQARLLGLRETVRRVKRILRECGAIYVSVDMDVFDPAYAPGVGNPEAEGMEPWFILDLLSAVVDERLVGFDVVEVSPPFDPGGITSVLAAKVLLEILAALRGAETRSP